MHLVLMFDARPAYLAMQVAGLMLHRLSQQRSERKSDISAGGTYEGDVATVLLQVGLFHTSFTLLCGYISDTLKAYIGQQPVHSYVLLA